MINKWRELTKDLLRSRDYDLDDLSDELVDLDSEVENEDEDEDEYEDEDADEEEDA